MASRGNKKTTMAKLNRERKLRERRVDKQAKKDARKQASADQRGDYPDVDSVDVQSGGVSTGQNTLEPALHSVGDA
jgi:hypothetical protein